MDANALYAYLSRRWCAVCGIVCAFWAMPLLADEDPLKTAPADVRKLLNTGGATWETYDPATQSSDVKNFHGSTAYEINFTAPYEFEFRGKLVKGAKRMDITVDFQPVVTARKLKVKVPRHRTDAEMWNDSLVRHELDHVAITADPRIPMLFERSLTSLQQFERKYSGKKKSSSAEIQAIIDEEMQLRRNAIYDLIRVLNQKLDQQTTHGTRSLKDRTQFFRELYEQPSLDEAKYPYLPEVAGLLKAKTYLEVKTLELKADRFISTPTVDK